MLAKGIKAAGLGVICFVTIIGHAFSYQASAVKVLARPESVVDPPRPIHISESVSTPKNNKARRTAPKAAKETSTIGPGIHKK